ncbi:SDR family NAD(P)-dependent oxidoreductase [Nocardia sp. NPDC058058]|uniref:SDR family NAD(P)-dependent oxidoreductase n=1 Tax=Nocardia sp. NPDC058058 TaxID=3346317 RepID=UPI0036DCF668
MNTRVQQNDSTRVQLPAATAAYWADRHVVITGGSSGIGLAVTELALGAGARVSVLALDDPAMTALAARTGEYDGRLATFTANVTSPDQIRAALNGARSQHGPIGAVIACAGIAKPGYFTELSESDFRNHMEVNYFGTLTPIREALPDMLTADRASITAISSSAPPPKPYAKNSSPRASPSPSSIPRTSTPPSWPPKPQPNPENSLPSPPAPP